tara:strand:- start:552 stop:839 length:288 start_codon:yes stop_codon:yes gene_type:complete
MDKSYVLKTLKAVFNNSLEDDSAWSAYVNFVDLFMQEHEETTDYLCRVVELNIKQRLVFRTKFAESGYELTPNQLNQYIFLLMLALNAYSESPNF